MLSLTDCIGCPEVNLTAQVCGNCIGTESGPAVGNVTCNCCVSQMKDESEVKVDIQGNTSEIVLDPRYYEWEGRYDNYNKGKLLCCNSNKVEDINIEKSFISSLTIFASFVSPHLKDFTTDTRNTNIDPDKFAKFAEYCFKERRMDLYESASILIYRLERMMFSNASSSSIISNFNRIPESHLSIIVIAIFLCMDGMSAVTGTCEDNLGAVIRIKEFIDNMLKKDKLFLKKIRHNVCVLRSTSKVPGRQTDKFNLPRSITPVPEKCIGKKVLSSDIRRASITSSEYSVYNQEYRNQVQAKELKRLNNEKHQDVESMKINRGGSFEVVEDFIDEDLN